MGLFYIFKSKNDLNAIDENLNHSIVKLEKLSKSITKQVDRLHQLPLQDLPEKLKVMTSVLKDNEETLQKTEQSIMTLEKIENGGAEFEQQIQDITINLSSLNAVVEMKLQDANSQMQQVHKLHNTLMNPLAEIESLTNQIPKLTAEIEHLKKEITSMNNL